MSDIVQQQRTTLRPEREPWIKSVRAGGSWQRSMTTDLTVRSFALRTDEPESAGGTNSAPTPMEMIAAAVNGCITVVVETVAAELGISIRRIETASAAHMDVRGFRGTAEVSPHFVDYTLTVSVGTDAAPHITEELRRLSEKRCPAVNLVRDAGVAFTLIWNFG
ncbi:OsmC family protein [Microbacterium sp. STN6]|uniref:OsmC family protein n=1 Tax=Microbacterium sp. STN6 TaxID=2995588 RepID=UPI002260C65C|nr:OsmC family protein [Microbacterium sp. STN6]MCX7521416.1 OsmC family protein [Microbacterium sp. STN6]